MAACLLSGNPAYLGVYAVYALTANVFKDTSKYLAATAVVLIDLLFAYYFGIFDNYTYFDLLSLSTGCAAFLLIPRSFLDKTAAELGSKGEKQLSRHIINRTRAELNSKIVKVSEVFYEMEKIFSGMVKGYMSPEDAVNMLASDCAEEVCSNCTEKAKCKKTDPEGSGIKAAIKAGIDKGRVTLLDIPPQLASVCVRTNSLLSACGRLSNSYRQYAIVVSNLDTSRSLIGRQFKGVGDILCQLARETKNSLGFDAKTEKAICDELAYNNIICPEAAVYNENNCYKNISLLVRTSDSNNKNLSKIISGLSGVKMVIYKREESRTPGYSVLHLKPAPRYDVIFGAAGCAKEGKSISGDTHSLTRISDDRFLLALCDGMGSGENAEKTSSTAISMVENFYKAGFDSGTILSAVNRLLNVGGDENFAALDICAIDLSKGVCDFIKLGAPEGYIKGKDNTLIIESNALPVGILEELTPSITTKNINPGDMVVLVSDGVAGVFADRDKLKEFIFSEDTLNPQQLAEDILHRALTLSGNVAKDDMTVLTMRVYMQV
jgi:stage II sporulation protein E